MQRKFIRQTSKQLSGMSGLSARQRESIIRNHSLEKAKRIMDDCQNKNISILCWNDERYPLTCQRNLLMHLPMLYYKGNIKEMDQTVGIVGARRCSQEAKTGNGISGVRICADPDCSCQRNGQRNRQLCAYSMSQCRRLYNSNIGKWSGHLLSK